jgi:hypothetical protein
LADTIEQRWRQDIQEIIEVVGDCEFECAGSIGPGEHLWDATQRTLLAPRWNRR